MAESCSSRNERVSPLRNAASHNHALAINGAAKQPKVDAGGFKVGHGLPDSVSMIRGLFQCSGTNAAV